MTYITLMSRIRYGFRKLVYYPDLVDYLSQCEYSHIRSYIPTGKIRYNFLPDIILIQAKVGYVLLWQAHFILLCLFVFIDVTTI